MGTFLSFSFIGDTHLFIPEEENLGRLSTTNHLETSPSPWNRNKVFMHKLYLLTIFNIVVWVRLSETFTDYHTLLMLISNHLLPGVCLDHFLGLA